MTEFVQQNWISIVGSLMGILYLYLEYKANIWMWAASIAMAAFYIFIFYNSRLYASMVIYIYFFAASIYGWLIWLFKQKNSTSGGVTISRTPIKTWTIISIAILFVAAVIYIILLTFSSNQGIITIGDALTTSLNIVALWMISRKWADQWLLLIPANAISFILLFIQHDFISGSMFVIFFVVSIGGFFNWKSMVKKESEISVNKNVNET